MATNLTSTEHDTALLRALAEWLRSHAEGQALLARWQADPSSLGTQLEAWLGTHQAAAPPTLATYVSDQASIKELINIANVAQLNIHLSESAGLKAAPPPPTPLAWFEPELVVIPEGPFLMGSDG